MTEGCLGSVTFPRRLSYLCRGNLYKQPEGAPGGMKIKVSIITVCKNEGPNVKMTIDSILSTTREVEIIVVSDGTEDGSCDFLSESPAYQDVKLLVTPGKGIAQARNLGATQATGDILVFCDCHLLFPEHWLEGMLETLALPEVGIAIPIIGMLQNPEYPGYCGMHVNRRLEAAWLPFSEPQEAPIEVPFTPSSCMMMRAGVFRQVGGFCDLFKPYGHEDLELSLRTSLQGYRMLVNPQVKVLHLFREWEKGRPYKINLEEHRYNVLLMAYLHLSRERIREVYQGIVRDLGIKKAIVLEKELFATDVFTRRTALAKTRKRSDGWFFSKFPMYTQE